jgi:hypothetical protein
VPQKRGVVEGILPFIDSTSPSAWVGSYMLLRLVFTRQSCFPGKDTPRELFSLDERGHLGWGQAPAICMETHEIHRSWPRYHSCTLARLAPFPLSAGSQFGLPSKLPLMAVIFYLRTFRTWGLVHCFKVFSPQHQAPGGSFHFNSLSEFCIVSATAAGMRGRVQGVELKLLALSPVPLWLTLRKALPSFLAPPPPDQGCLMLTRRVTALEVSPVVVLRESCLEKLLGIESQ